MKDSSYTDSARQNVMDDGGVIFMAGLFCSALVRLIFVGTMCRVERICWRKGILDQSEEEKKKGRVRTKERQRSQSQGTLWILYSSRVPDYSR